MPLSASQHEKVSSLLSVPNDLSGLLSVIPIALFGSEAVRATGSLILSFAGVLVCSFIITVGAKRFDCSDVFLRLVKMACGNGLKYGELYGWSPSGRTTPYPSSFASSARRLSGMSTDQICTGPVYTSIDNVPPPPTLHLCDAARTKHRYIHIRPEVVGWAPPV